MIKLILIILAAVGLFIIGGFLAIPNKITALDPPEVKEKYGGYKGNCLCCKKQKEDK